MLRIRHLGPRQASPSRNLRRLPVLDLQDAVDALPTLPGWAWVQADNDAGPETWAVDVAANEDGRYYMYFSTEANRTVTPEGVHCLGVAVASDPIGPFYPSVEYWDEPWECDTEAGVIDPEQFTDRGGEKFVLYKVDGNHVDRGSTPIMIQRVDANGRTKVGDAIQILDREEAGGPLIEATLPQPRRRYVLPHLPVQSLGL